MRNIKMLRKPPAFLSLLAIGGVALSAGATKQGESAPSVFEAALAGITARPVYLHASWGLAIADLSPGKTLYEQNAQKLFAPASTTKLFSTAAALAAFGPDHRFVTPVFRTGPVENGQLRGDLVLRASGDPSLSGRIDSSGHLAWTNFDHTYADGTTSEVTLCRTDALSGIDDLALQIQQAGIRGVHDVLIDDRLFEKAEGSGSGPSQLVPIVVNDNVIDLEVSPAEQVGGFAKIVYTPVSAYAEFDSAIVTVAAGQPSHIDVQEVSPQRYSVRGQIALGHAPIVQIAEVSSPAAFARALFIERLRAKGIAVEASEFASASPLPAADAANLTRVASHTSPPFQEQIKVILKVSHNLAASLLPLLLSTEGSRHTLDAGMQREGVLLKQIGVDVGGISFAGGAGGTRADFVSPSAVIGLLQAMAKRPDFASYHDGMPVLGVDGTLVKAVGAGSPARGKVFAKTGTLVWEDPLNQRLLLLSKAMSGYLTSASGRQLAIAVYLNNVSVKDAKEIEEQGRALGEIAELIYRSF